MKTRNKRNCILCDWKEIPSFMKTAEVKYYYERLKKVRWKLRIKRYVDIILSLVLIIFFSPLFLMLALAIRYDSDGPIFYRQERVTQYGKIFKIYKFRTMVQDADKVGKSVTSYEDPRITRIGKTLRKKRFDELPQLFNILKGDMTFVGTRPEVPEYVKHYTRKMYATLLLPAGVTSAASLTYRDEDLILGREEDRSDNIYIQKILPRKMKINLKELREFSMKRDFFILCKTIREII